MARKKKTERDIQQYDHRYKDRINNPHVGLVNEKTDPDYGQVKKTYQYDPHLDPQLQWAGKAEHTSFQVPTVSLHVHERIDPKTIIETVRGEKDTGGQLSLFHEEKKPLREAIEFYKHREGWTNRLIAGDSLLVMNSLLEKEGMAGQVQMVYFDPPYGIKYGSNFQPFMDKRDVKDGKDEDLTQEPEMIKAFRDTWELGIHSYLTYLRDRLLLARELLHESGSVFVQIGDENVHKIRILLDEVFGESNFVSLISYKTSIGLGSKNLDGVCNYVVWYTKDSSTLKYRQLFKELELGGPGATRYNYVESKDGTVRRIKKEEIFDNSLLPKGSRVFFKQGLTSRSGSEGTSFEIEFKGKKYKPTAGGWRTGKSGIDNLIKRNRIAVEGNRLTFKKYFDDFGYMAINNFWDDVSGGIASRTDPKIYVVQTSTKIVERCLLMATDPGDLVLDITCGAGTTAYVSEQWGRRWVTCDTSRVAITLAKQRLMTTNFDFYELAHKTEGIGSGLKYKSVPYVTLRTIANNEPPAEIILYDQPLINKEKTRITGPFTVESVPAPIAKSFDDLEDEPGSDTSIARSGETLRQAEWRDELLRAGVRVKGNAQIEFSRVEPLSGAKYIQAEAETKVKPPDKNLFEKDNQMSLEQRPQKVLVVFGPEHAPLEQRTVELALDEARYLKPDILLFCAFMFDEEAAKDIDETPEHLVGFKLLKAQMNMDLQTHDLKKKSGTNESFWLVGQPDVRVHKITKGEEKGKVQVEVMGFDYYNPKTGKVESGGKKNIAMWMLDTDYDGRSIFPSQVFFPMAGKKDGWAKLAKNLKAEIDEEKIEAFRGTKSLLFEPGKAIAVKIVDDRGIESLRVIKM